MALTKVTYSMIQGGVVNALDYMTPAQVDNVTSRLGTIDVTAAVQAAMNSGAKAVYLPAGVYGIAGALTFPISPTQEVGFKLFGDGITATVLKAMVGNTSTDFLTIGNPNYLTTGYSTDNELCDLQLDGSNLPDTQITNVLTIIGTFNNSIKNIRAGTGNFPNARIDIRVKFDVYTTEFNSCWGNQLYIGGSGVPFNTTLTFIGGSWNTINVYSTHVITFIGVTLQGFVGVGYPLTRLYANNVDSLAYRNSDFEGDGINVEFENCKKCQIVECQFAISSSNPDLTCIVKSTDSSNIVFRDNCYPNWVSPSPYSPFTPAGPKYFIDGGGNNVMELNDFQFVNYFNTGSYTPTFTGLTVVNGTGGATYSGTWIKTGTRVFFTVKITVTGTCTTASTAGVTRFDLPVVATNDGTCQAADSSLTVSGNGFISSGTQFSFLPAWAAINTNVIITGDYTVNP
jgi:hypothetical protein